MAHRLKIIVMVVNLALVTGGIIFIAFGIDLWNIEQMVFEYTSKLSLGSVVTGIGAFLVLVSAFGVVAVMVDFIPILVVYIAALIILFIIQVGTAVLALMESMYKEQRLTNRIEESLHVTFNSGNRYKIGRVQQDFKCCGVHNAYFWIVEKEMDSLPLSCCRNYICFWGYYGPACLEAASKAIADRFTTIAYLLLAFAVLELVACCLACVSHRFTKREKDQI